MLNVPGFQYILEGYGIRNGTKVTWCQPSVEPRAF